MNQSNALTDALLKTPSLLGGLMTQMDDATGGNRTQSGFSNLLSSNDSSNVASTATTTSVSASATNGFTASSVKSIGNGGDTTASTLQNLNNLSTTLHRVLDALRQKTKSATSANASQASAHTAPANTTVTATAATSTTDAASTNVTTNAVTVAVTDTPKAKTSTATDASTTTGAATSATASDTTATLTGTNDVLTLANIIAELLALTQSVIQNLQTAPAANVAVAQGSGTDALTALNALTQTPTGDSSAATGTADTPLMQLLTVLQDTTKQLMTATFPETQTSGSTNATAGKKTDAQSLADLWNTLAVTPQTNTTLSDSVSGTVQTPVTTPDTVAATETASLAMAAGTAPPATFVTEKPVTAFTSADLTTTATKTAATTATTAAPLDVVKQLAALDNGLKKVLASLQQTSADAASTANTATELMSSAPPANDTGNSNLSGKQVAAESRQAQLAGVTGNATTSNASATPTATTQPTTASAAFAVSADKNAGSGSDTMSNKDHSSFGNTGTNTNANTGFNATAEGVQATGTYNFASQLSAFRATNGGAVGLPSAVDQVILQMNRSVKNGNDQMSLQLSPGDLGKITVKLDFGADGKVQGTVVAENPKTLDMLQKDSRSLERALQDAGLRADPGSLQFSLGGQSGQNNAGQSASNGRSGSGNGTVSASDNGDASELVDIGSLSETYYLTPSGVNIRV